MSDPRTPARSGPDLPTSPAVQGVEPSLYRSLLGAVLDPTIAIDGYGRILVASDSCERLFGWASGELLGQNIKVLLPEPHHSSHDGYLASYRRTGETSILGRTREFQVLHKDGHLIDCELSVSRVDDHPEPIFVGSFRDVTDRKRVERALRQSEQRLHAIFDRSYEYIGLLTPEGIVLEANRASLEGIGLAREDVVGRPFWETPWWSGPGGHREQIRDAIRRAAQGEFVRFETQHPNAEGEPRAIDFSLSPLRDEAGEVVLLIPEGRDITELKRALQAETAVLRALATIGESAAVLAHEIKNPITAVNLALRAVADQLGEDHRAVLDDLVERMQRLEAVMRRTLSFTRPLELQESEFELGALLEEAAHDLRPGAEATDLAIEVRPIEVKIGLHADRQLIGEVLINLIHNALEALEEHGGRRVVLSADPKADSGVTVTVEDDGPGIPESLRPNLFKPFHTTKRAGTGLGLAFCRKVVEEHGGALEADSSSLGGARFTLHLPCLA